MKYKVLKQHFGNCQYWAGDVRIIDNATDAAELVRAGLIAPMGDVSPSPVQAQAQAPKAKQAPKPRNKIAPSPDNKAVQDAQD